MKPTITHGYIRAAINRLKHFSVLSYETLADALAQDGFTKGDIQFLGEYLAWSPFGLIVWFHIVPFCRLLPYTWVSPPGVLFQLYMLPDCQS